MSNGCFLSSFSGTVCGGRTDPAHLIPKQLLKREHIDELWDPRIIVPACRKHHGELDVSRTLTIPREALPEGVEAFAALWGLTWWLEREYGPLEAAA